MVKLKIQPQKFSQAFELLKAGVKLPRMHFAIKRVDAKEPIEQVLNPLVLREVEVKTPGFNPTGDTYEHPSKAQLHFDNPITTVYHYSNHLYFGSKNGQAGVIQQTSW